MFIWEGKKTVSETEVETLNIKFQATQIPTDTPDVQLYRSGNTVTVTIGGTSYTGTIS